MKTTTIRADEITKGMTVKVRGHGRKNRTTIYVTNITSALRMSNMRIWGDNVNAPYGQRSQVCRIVDREELVEVVQ